MELDSAKQNKQAGISRLDPAAQNPNRFLALLKRADKGLLPALVDDILNRVQPALESQAFCQYLALSVRFAAGEFVAGLDLEDTGFSAALEALDITGRYITQKNLRQYILAVFTKAVALRERQAAGQGTGMERALDYIEMHFQEPSLTLNSVASAAELTPNYFSAVFRQEMGCTFIDYVTQKRMTLACRLLLTTDKPSGQIAQEVGYRDPHYFSALFKKIQKCSPRAYRNRGKPPYITGK